MELTLEQLAPVVIVFMFLMGVVSFYVGKKKTTWPIKAGLLGFVFSIIPVMGIAYVVYLYAKEDVVNNNNS